MIGRSEHSKDTEERITELEKVVNILQLKLHSLEKQQRSHIIRLNNGEILSNDSITRDAKYQDLSPEQAFEFYNSKDKNFLLLDVSDESFQPIADFPESVHIPYEHLSYKLGKLPNKSASILVISEDGLNSIKACEFLYRAGYYNLNNVSGGYKYWVGFNNLRRIGTSSKASA